MRFFKFVSCCGPPLSCAPRRREETRGLVPLSCAAGEPCAEEKSRRRRSVAWRPSLVAISEDSVASVRPTRKGDRTVGSGKGFGAKDGSRAQIRVRDYRERFGHSGIPAVLPAFSPTAFLF